MRSSSCSGLIKAKKCLKTRIQRTINENFVLLINFFNLQNTPANLDPAEYDYQLYRI